jgi:Scaffold protein Nfu/NifU N terminal
MGQPITVLLKRTSVPDVVRFEINRSLTGMGHERYRSRDAAVAERPVDELARRLFDTGGVDAVHVNSNVVTVDLREGADPEAMVDVIRDLFIYYREGVRPPADEELLAPTE